MTQRYIIGHLDWDSRARFTAGLVVAGVLFASLGMMILRPWDPFGAISLQLVDNSFILLIKIGGLLLAVGVFAAILMDARLPFFGLFAACAGMGIPIAKTAGMAYVMVRQQAAKAYEHPHDLQSLWGYLVLETLAWTVVLAVLVVGIITIEQWIKRSNISVDQESQPVNSTKKKTSTLPWARGLGGTVITAVLAIFLIAMLAASMKKGQTIFATAFGFFLAALIAEQIAENDHPVWQVAAVPVVAIAAFVYTWCRPDRPPRLEALLNIAPNSLARVLPVEYIFMGTAGAIFGNWTSHRMRHSKDNG